MEINTNVDYLKNKKCADVYTESATDYVLPDYLGDVRKILYTEATLNPSGRFAGGDEVEFSGIVVYNLIYLDANGELSSVSFTSDYGYSVKCSGENYSDSVADTRVSNYAVRLVGPRKINAKASLVGSVRLSERETLGISGDGFSGENHPELDSDAFPIRSSRVSATCEREYAESVARLDGAIADEVSVVYPFGEAVVEEVIPSDSSACVKGKLRMCAVIKNGDEPAYSTEKVIPFEESVELEGADEAMRLVPDVRILSLRPNVNADEVGSEVVISCIMEICVIAEENQTVELTRDGYLKEKGTDNEYSDFNYETIVDASSVKGSHSAELSRGDMESEWIHEVIFLSSTPRVDSVTLSDGVVTLLGEIRYSGIASEMMDEKNSYFGIKFSSPFTINVNLDCQNDAKTHVEAEIHTYNTSATLDNEKLYATCSIDCSVMAVEDRCERILSSMSVKDEESEEKTASITVYYPTSEDTLFSVAKRFRSSRVKIAKDNGVTEKVFSSDNPHGSLAGIKKLIIY